MRSVLVIGALALCQQAQAAQEATWLLSYAGKSTDKLLLDKRASELIHERLPAELADKVEGALGGQPDPVRVSGQRYVSMSACFPHACNEKGFLWVDTLTGNALGADADCSYAGEGKAWACVITLGSAGLTHASMPPEALQALRAWMTAQDFMPVSVGFVGAGGARAQLDAEAYAPRAPAQDLVSDRSAR